MRKQAILFGVVGIVFFLLAPAAPSMGSDAMDPPDFSKWKFIDEEPLIYPQNGVPYKWGVQRKYRFPSDPRRVGFEGISESGEVFFKSWGVEGEALATRALRQKEGDHWFGGWGSQHSVSPSLDAAGRVNGVWFSLHRKGEFYGRIFPVFPSQPSVPRPSVPLPSSPRKEEEGKGI